MNEPPIVSNKSRQHACFANKNILLGVTGGIAAYKALELTSRLRKAGADVHVIMTRAAKNFVTELSFREISGHSVASDMWEEHPSWNVEHIALADLADLILIAPATANLIAKAACGIADDMLTTVLLAAKAPIFCAPAMNCNMYDNPIVQQNIRTLSARGWHLIKPASGHLACGTFGIGRLPEPEEILRQTALSLTSSAELAGKKILVTAGGTREPIDPVRYISNRSSGKMGYAIAAEAISRGAAEVVLVSAPSHQPVPAGVRLINIETAREMRSAVLAEFPSSDIIIKAAAVADYRPREIAAEKIKKAANDCLCLEMVKNPDILAELGMHKRKEQLLIGFAAETQNLILNAKEKMQRKNLDYIIANEVNHKNSGFNSDNNIIKILSRNGNLQEFPLLPKQELAALIFDHILANNIF